MITGTLLQRAAGALLLLCLALPSSAALTAVNNACLAFCLARIGDFVVWTRPKAAGSGSVHVVVTGTMQDKSFVLRSRRD